MSDASEKIKRAKPVPQNLIAQVKKLLASGNLLKAGAVATLLVGAPPVPEIQDLVADVISLLRNLAMRELNRGDLGQVRIIVGLLKRLEEPHSERTREIEEQLRVAQGTAVESSPSDELGDILLPPLEDNTGRIGQIGVGSTISGAGRASSVPLERGADHDSETRRGSRRGTQVKGEPRPRKPQSQPIPAIGESVVERVPHMDLKPDGFLRPGSTVTVLVYADQQGPHAGEQSEGVVISGSPSQNQFQIDVELLVSGHFAITREPRAKGRSGPTIILRRDQAVTNSLSWSLKVLSIKRLPATRPTITALFEYKGRPSGKVIREPAIRGHSVKSQDNKIRRVTIGALSMIVPQAKRALPSVAVQKTAKPADLMIKILETEEKDGRHFKLTVDARPIRQQWSGPWTLRDKTDVIVGAALATFPTSDLSSPAKRIAALIGPGSEMFRSTPQQFQDLFWQMADHNKLPTSILIISEEKYMPWELMVPERRKKDGTIEQRQALGVEFAVGRWVTDKYLSPPQEVALRDAYVISPQYPVGRQLRNAADEVSMILNCFSPATPISPALVANIDGTLAQAGATVLHFVCHGKAGLPQALSLDQDREQLTAWDIRGLKGFLTSFAKSHTFVFLNACEVGRAAPSLVGVGGFGNSFVEIGSSAVVAPLWSVDDGIAHEVAKQFYEEVRKAPSIAFAEILRRIRAKAYSGNAEDTWAAYCFYGDPLAHRV